MRRLRVALGKYKRLRQFLACHEALEMTLLAFNTLLPERMRGKYPFAVGVLPIGLLFASFVAMC
jgi:hypothetical protein